MTTRAWKQRFVGPALRGGRPLSIVLLALALPASAAAHRDYERISGTVETASGTTLQFVRHYTDGIVVADPVKLIVRDEAGNDVAETEYGGDVVVWCSAGPDCLVFHYAQGPGIYLWPDKVLRFNGAQLTDADSGIAWFAGWWMPLYDHYAAFGILGWLILTALCMRRLARSLAHGPARAAFGGLLGVLGGLGGLALLMNTFFGAPLSVGAAAVCAAAVWGLYRALDFAVARIAAARSAPA